MTTQDMIKLVVMFLLLLATLFISIAVWLWSNNRAIERGATRKIQEKSLAIPTMVMAVDHRLLLLRLMVKPIDPSFVTGMIWSHLQAFIRRQL